MTWAAPLGYTGRSVVVGRGRWCWSFGCGLHTNAVLRRATEFIMTQYTTPTVPEKGPLGSCFFGFCANAQEGRTGTWNKRFRIYRLHTCRRTFSKRSISPQLSIAALGIGLIVLAREEGVATLQSQAEPAVRQVLLAVGEHLGEHREEGEHEQDGKGEHARLEMLPLLWRAAVELRHETRLRAQAGHLVGVRVRVRVRVQLGVGSGPGLG
eukprot:scaffold61348_cov55-Phaeocystis_antarctica.AAC.4